MAITVPNIATTENEENEVAKTTKTEKTEKTDKTEIVIQTTIIEEKKETHVVFLGGSKLIIQSSFFTFPIYFLLVKNSSFSKKIIITISILFNANLRRLENEEVICNIDEANTLPIIGYKCDISSSTSDINRIKIDDFNFDSNNNIKLVGITPIGKLFMDNIIEANEKYGSLLSSNITVYILDNSSICNKETDQFNICGIINGTKPKSLVKNKNLTLIANGESEQENKTKELNCTVMDIKDDNNYTLNCKSTESLKYFLQNSISIIGDGLLILNFDFNNYTDSSVTTEEKEEETKISNIIFNNKKSKGLSAGSIIALVLTSIAVLAALIAILLYFRKRVKRNAGTDSVMKFYQ